MRVEEQENQVDTGGKPFQHFHIVVTSAGGYEYDDVIAQPSGIEQPVAVLFLPSKDAWAVNQSDLT